MCYRTLRGLLLIVGSLLLFTAVFPVLAFIDFGEPLQTALMASKLVMLPVSAICFLVAAQMRVGHR